MNIPLAFSPCPNDTFIFHALLHGLIDTGPYTFRAALADVEELNTKAGYYPLTKLSFAAYFGLRGRFALLDAGAALGFGCGPLLVARRGLTDLAQARIAVPGRHTTAYLLLRLWNQDIRRVEFTRFDAIMPGIASGRYDAGLIIHEGRFVYPSFGLNAVADLGAWWESETGLPIPLGCIALRSDLQDHREALGALIRASILHARAHPEDSLAFIKAHAQAMDETVIREHIALYVNDFSLGLDGVGRQAVQVLQERATAAGII